MKCSQSALQTFSSEILALPAIPEIYPSAGIDLKKLGSAAEMCGIFFICPGIEIYSRFSLKNERTICRHELGAQPPTQLPSPDNSNPVFTLILSYLPV